MCVSLTGAKEWMTFESQELRQWTLEHQSIWVSPLKPRERCGYEIEVVQRARGINTAYWAVISGLSRCYTEWADRHFWIFFPFFYLMVVYFSCSVNGWYKGIRSTWLPFVFVHATVSASEVLCVCQSMHDRIANINPYVDELQCMVAVYISVFRRGESSGDVG